MWKITAHLREPEIGFSRDQPGLVRVNAGGRDNSHLIIYKTFACLTSVSEKIPASSGLRFSQRDNGGTTGTHHIGIGGRVIV